MQDFLLILMGFSLVVLHKLQCVGSAVVVHGLSCPTARGILITQPGIKPTFPALEDGFLTNGPRFSSVQSHSRVSLGPHGLQHPRLPCPSQIPSLLRFISIKSVMPFNHLILCHPLLLPSILPTIRVFSNESVLRIRWPKYWSEQLLCQFFQ